MTALTRKDHRGNVHTPRNWPTSSRTVSSPSPVTSFDAQLQFDEENYRKHLAWQASFPVAGLFAAGGTGEGFSLTPAESERVVRTAVEEVGSVVPVLASAGGSTAQAIENAKLPSRGREGSCCCRRTSLKPTRRA